MLLKVQVPEKADYIVGIVKGTFEFLNMFRELFASEYWFYIEIQATFHSMEVLQNYSYDFYQKFFETNYFNSIALQVLTYINWFEE